MSKNNIKTDQYGNKFVYRLGVYVSKDGKYIHTDTRECKIYEPKDEEPYVKINKRIYFVADLVALCYKPKPSDGKVYTLVHVDGNFKNCDVNNLRWDLYVYKLYNKPTRKIMFHGEILTVTSNGEVFTGNYKLKQYNDTYDDDVDLFVCIRPYVFIGEDENRAFLDEVFEKAEYIQGDRDSLQHPRILHIDHNRNNYASSNLLWVEETDSDYKNFRKDEIEDMKKRNVEINPGVDFPDFMQPK